MYAHSDAADDSGVQQGTGGHGFFNPACSHAACACWRVVHCAAVVMAAMDRFGRKLGSPEGNAFSFKLYLAEGVCSFTVMTAMHLGDLVYRRWAMFFVVPVVVTCIRSNMIALMYCRCFHDDGVFRVDDDDNVVGKAIAWSYPVTSVGLVMWHILGVLTIWVHTEHPHQTAQVLTAAGFAWLIVANVFLCCTSLISFRWVLKIQRDSRRQFVFPMSFSTVDMSFGTTMQDLTLRTFTIGEDGAIDIDPNQLCAICLTGYSAGDLAKEMSCGHMFHSQCIDTWFSVDIVGRCPMRCGTRLEDSARPNGFEVVNMPVPDAEQGDTFSNAGLASV